MESFFLGPARIEPLRNLICINNKETRIEPQAMQVLLCLARRPGEVFTRDELLSAAWPDTFTCDGVLAKTICAIRKALGDNARRPSFIETIPKVGYRLMVDVQPLHQVQGSTSGDRPAASKSRKNRNWVSNLPRLQRIPFQTAIMALFIVLSGVLAFLLFSQPDYATEEVTVFKSYEMDGASRIDSTVVIRTNLSEGESLNDRYPALTDTTIEVIKRRQAP